MATKADLQALRAEFSELRGDFATKTDLQALRADVASDLLTVRKELGEQIVGLRRAVTPVIGHGVLISDLEARLRRVEQHLDLPPLGAT